MIYRNTKIVILTQCIAAFFIVGCSPKAAEKTSSLETDQQPNLAAKELKKRTINKKIAPRIAALVERTNTPQSDISNQFINTKDSQVQVYVVVASTEEDDIALLTKLGLEIQIINTKLKKIQAWVSFDNIEKIADINNVLAITTPSYSNPRTRKNPINSKL